LIASNRCAGRRGLTLLEVIVSMAIFLIALGAIVPLVQMGQERSLDVQLQTMALKKCQSKLAEVTWGSEPLFAATDTAFPDNPPDENWVWSMELTSGYNGINNLYLVTVRVRRDTQDGGNTAEVSLSQLVMDPQYRGSAAPTTNSSNSSSAPAAGTGGGM
jgi:general secretion pathway protein I